MKKLIQENMNLVKFFTKKYLKYIPREVDDLFSEGCLGLVEAANRWKKNPPKGKKNCSFRNFAATYIQGRIYRHVGNVFKNRKRYSVYPDIHLADTYSCQEQFDHVDPVNNILADWLIVNLPHDERKIIRERISGKKWRLIADDRKMLLSSLTSKYCRIRYRLQKEYRRAMSA